jgi:glycosyltransferase involved in cell wall biosynthesis
MTALQPLFTVAMVTYNSSKWVQQAIESVLSSSFKEFELIISDDYSTDETWNLIQSYKDPRIRKWQNPQNLGEYPNRNKVIREAKGAYILFVDGDDILYRHSLRNLSEFVDAFPEAGMVWGLNPQHFPFYVFPYLVQPVENIKLIYQTIIPISTIGFGEMLFKTEVLKNNGGMPEQYIIGDTYIKKMLALVTPVLFVPIGFMFWRQSDEQASKKYDNKLTTFLERVSIDNQILKHPAFPLTGEEKKTIVQNVRIGIVKLYFTFTLLKGDLIAFINLRQKVGLSLKDCMLLFKKGNYQYKPSPFLGEPRINNFNFIQSVNDESA